MIQNVGGNPSAWQSQALLTDNDVTRSRANFAAVEMVEVMSGTGVNVFQPTSVSHLHGLDWVQEDVQQGLTPMPAPDLGATLFPNLGCGIGEVLTVKFDDYVVWVPSAFAVPMLTSWQIDNWCRDRPLGVIGAYIDHFSFTPSQDKTSGWLSYTVASYLADDTTSTSGQLGTTKNEVSILGLNPRPPRPYLPPRRANLGAAR
jgi:hypothetical protein